MAPLPEGRNALHVGLTSCGAFFWWPVPNLYRPYDEAEASEHGVLAMQGSAALLRGGIVILFLISVLVGQADRALGVEREGGSVSQQERPLELSPVVVTATRGERASFDVPNAVTIIDHDDVGRKTPTVLPDLLRGETGVFVQQTTPGQAAPIVRGLNGSGVLMLVDGVGLDTALFRSPPT